LNWCRPVTGTVRQPVPIPRERNATAKTQKRPDVFMQHHNRNRAERICGVLLLSRLFFPVT
jgi:hypothetical protein